MSDPATNGIHLTKKYYKDFLPTDLQWDVTKIDDDFTLYDLFRLIYHADQITPGIAVTFGMRNFELFWNQINADREPDDKNDVTYLELYWAPEYKLKDEVNEEDPSSCEMSNLMSLHGMGPGCPSEEYHECDESCPKEHGYGIEFSPLNNLAHLPIHVSPSVEFYPPFVQNQSDFHKTEFQLTINPTLWCFITSVLWELTFVDSTPDKIADSAKQLFDQIGEIRKQLTDENTDRLEDL